jgi:membrane protein YdbS with pleckstrin-like domain
MQEFTNDTIDIDLLPKYQEVILNSPDSNYWKVILINISLCALFMAIGLGSLLFFNEKNHPYLLYCIAGFVLLFVFIFFIYKASFRKRGYALREKDIIFKSGIIAESTAIVPLNRIQHVALNEGFFSRMYGLATLQIHTAGGATGHIHIAGVPIYQAKTIKEALLKKIDLLDNVVEEHA